MGEPVSAVRCTATRAQYRRFRCERQELLRAPSILTSSVGVGYGVSAAGSLSVWKDSGRFSHRRGLMKDRTICITEHDKERLMELMAVAKDFGGRDRRDLVSLSSELSKATVVFSKEVPPEIVTMNSKVALQDLDSREEMIFTLTFPKDANVDRGCISVLAPVGTAILGYAKGDVVEWPVPSGTRRIRIMEILYQPEAAGDYRR